MSNPCLDDQLGFDIPNDLLHRDEVLWILNDGPTEPLKIVGVIVAATAQKKFVRQTLEFGVGGHPDDLCSVFWVVILHTRSFGFHIMPDLRRITKNNYVVWHIARHDRSSADNHLPPNPNP